MCYKFKYLTFGYPKGSGSLTKVEVEVTKVEVGYFENRVRVSANRRLIYLKLHMAFPKNLEYLTSGDPKASWSLIKIYKLEYCENGVR